MKALGFLENKSRPFGIRDKVGYMFGDFGCNMSFQLLSSYLMLFVTQGLKITTGHWAIIVLVSKIFDAINDPIIGALVDSRKPSKYGKFRPWIFVGAFAIALTTILLFIDIRGISYGGRFAYCIIMYCLWSIAYTAANVPYGSLNAALTDDSAQRASLSSLRSIGAGLAAAPMMIVVPMLIYGEKDANGIQPLKPEVFIWIAIACAVIGIICFMVTVFCTSERGKPSEKGEKFNYFKTLGSFLKNRAALGMCLASFSQLVFVMSYATMLPLVCQLFFKDGSMSGLVGIAMMAPMMLVIPFMGKLTKKFGKKEISVWPNVFAIVVLVVMLFIPFPRTTGGMFAYAAMLAVAMLAAAPFTLGTWSMVADCVDDQEVKTGRREEASVYATYSLARKIAQGIGASFVALCAGGVGYDSTNVQATTAETANGLLKLSIGLPLVGFVIVFIALLFIYDLNKKKVDKNTEILREKRQAEEREKEIFETIESEVSERVVDIFDFEVENQYAENEIESQEEGVEEIQTSSEVAATECQFLEENPNDAE